MSWYLLNFVLFLCKKESKCFPSKSKGSFDISSADIADINAEILQISLLEISPANTSQLYSHTTTQQRSTQKWL